MTRIESVRVTAPSRLHFGLLAFGEGHERQFGGLGAMIDRPRLVLTARRAKQFESHGPGSERAAEFMRRVMCYLDRPEEGVRIDIDEAPRPHTGLGTGTQLGLSIAQALFALFDHECGDPAELARASGRGLRSAVGTYGFSLGGLVFEEGKGPCEDIAPLSRHITLPANWRFLLLTSRDAEGLAGNQEQTAFDRLPSVSLTTTEKLRRVITEEILPAAEKADFDTFSDAIYRYGYTSGTCFASEQSGPFASPQIESIVNALRDQGILGVGQSSWGPTVFALAREKNLDEFFAIAESVIQGTSTEIRVAAPAAEGAIVEAIA